MPKFKNIFELYELEIEDKNYDKSNKILPKVTKLIMTAIKRKRWADVERISKKYYYLGAEDTASRDAMIDVWRKLFKTKPRGFV